MVVRPRKSSVCFAVHALRKTLRGRTRLDGRAPGTVKDFLVEKHLDKFVSNGPRLRRNFTFWWRWTSPTEEIKFEEIPANAKPHSRGYRVDEYMKSPFENQSRPVVRVAVMVKFRRYSNESMEGLVSDHNNSVGGWHTMDWRKIRAIPWDEDTDRGWFVW